MITHHLDDILESLPHPLLLEGLYLPRTQYPRGIMTDGIEGVVVKADQSAFKVVFFLDL